MEIYVYIAKASEIDNQKLTVNITLGSDLGDGGGSIRS
jgi:hypothetical protein